MSADTQFSWLRAIQAARAAIASNPSEALVAFERLRSTLFALPMQGFELQMLGGVLRDDRLREDVTPQTIRCAVIAGTTSDPLTSAVRVAAFKERLFAEVYEVPYGTYHQEILAPTSSLYQFQPEVVLLALGTNNLNTLPGQPMTADQVEAALDAEVQQYQMLWQALGERLGVPVLQHTLVVPESAWLGMAERRLPWSPMRLITQLNQRLLDAAPAFVHWVDVDQLAATVGRMNWHDPRLMFHGKYGFANQVLPEYTVLLGAGLRGVLGRSPKALILDLDNTLWGGVIGDDGIHGIQLGPDSPAGEAYQAFGQYIKALSLRGVILGICSKNDLTTVTEVFEQHPHMPLLLPDFAVVRCNWQDKASNLQDIARELNIDVASLVLVDDNPAECELIRQVLPTVRVVQLEGDPALFVRKLDSTRLFDSQHLSREDLQRTESYQARVQANRLQQQATDLQSYLESLQMRGKVVLAGAAELPRLAQMELKTNQFNLSTRRLGQPQIEAMIDSPAHTVLAVFLADRFADHGLVAYVAAEWTESTLVITDWLMSCRVFARTLEAYTLRHLLNYAQERSIQLVRLNYVPTAKNTVMLQVFETLGFQPQGSDQDCAWSYQAGQDPLPQTFVQDAS